MFAKLKESFLKKQLRTALLKSASNRVVSEKQIISVGVLTLDSISATLDLQKEIETVLNVRNVKLISFRNFDALDDVSFKHFSEKDIGWSGNFTQENLDSFLMNPFDLLVGYFNTENLYLETAVLKSKATFKAGFSGVNPLLYELEISEKITNHTQFISELKKYLAVLKKCKN